MKYFHGGVPKLRIGAMILPPTKTGARCCSDFGAADVHRRDRVYVTTDPVAAIMFGAMYPRGRGWVYEVEPIGEIVHDPDCNSDALSFECESAKVLSGRAISKSERRGIFDALGLPKSLL